MRNTVLRLLQLTLIVMSSAGVAGIAVAEDDPTFIIELKDGTVSPQRLEVPAGKRIVLEVHNAGKTAVEFESKPLKKEVIVAPGKKTSVTIRKLEPGEYSFFDEFHEGAKGVVVAK
jgi:plastocyanin